MRSRDSISIACAAALIVVGACRPASPPPAEPPAAFPAAPPASVAPAQLSEPRPEPVPAEPEAAPPPPKAAPPPAAPPEKAAPPATSAPAEPPEGAPPPPSERPRGRIEVGATKPGLSRIGVDGCRKCHKVQYDSWLKTKHAQEAPPLDCESCHGPGSEYKALAIMKDPAQARAAGLVIPDTGFCTKACHQERWTDDMLARSHDHKR